MFDRHWNLYANDNDHESQPADYVPARLLHVTPRADFSWPRGWMASKTPDRADVLETMTTSLGREVPVGLSYYDEAFLPPAHRGCLLLARWGQRRVDRFSLVPRGASFQAGENPLLLAEGTARPVGVTVGRGGRIFAIISYMQNNEESPRYVSDLVMITTANDSAEHPFEAYDLVAMPPDRLWAELSHADWWRRGQSHQEILRRGGELLIEATRRLGKAETGDAAIEHLIWLAAAGGPEARQVLATMSGHPDAKLRLQAIRALDEFTGLGAPRDMFVKALSDPDPQVCHAAVLALFQRPGPLPRPLIRGPARGTDTYLRQASAFLIAEVASLDEIDALCRSDDRATRLAGVLAAGTRLTIPRANDPIPDEVPLRYESTNARFVIQYADQTINLRDLGRVGSFTTAERWKFARRTEEQVRLFDLLVAMLDDPEDQIRLQAAHYLSLLNDARTEPLVATVRQASSSRRLARAPLKPISQAWFLGPLLERDEASNPGLFLANRPIDLSIEYRVGRGSLDWTLKSADESDELIPFQSPAEGCSYAYFRLESGRSERAELLVRPDDGIKVWHNGRQAAAAGPLMLDLVSGSNDIVIRLAHARGDVRLSLAFRAAGQVAATVPQRLGLATLAERLRAGSAQGDTKIAPELLAVDWTRVLAEGSAERGRKLFGADALGCVKCHAITLEQDVAGGPSLAGAAKRFTVAHVVESILLPSKQVAPVFRATSIATIDGQVLVGLVMGETGEAVELLLPDASHRSIARSTIEERKLQDVSPMPSGLVKRVDELRDLLAYLLSENPQPP